MKHTLFLIAALLSNAAAAPPASTGAGSYTIEGGAGREEKEIAVHFYMPRDFTRRSPVLMVIPGSGRNAWNYRDAWAEA